MQDIIEEVNAFLTNSVDPLQERFLFQGRPSEATLKDAPLILILGNHSSGKSTFINYFTESPIQLTGMAPTDDDFTIIKGGPVEKERPGSSVVSNPALGLEGLSQFGPKFLSHLKLKSIPNTRLERVTLVDSPGMIDSADANAQREYNFQSVVRWFAERADLITLFFDPERPGTTAETLEIYTSALSDFDHKLMVIFNKVDQFQRLSDFARCYGNLCWNLGKVMRTKDLPQIYTTYVPSAHSSTSPLDLSEFDEARALLIKKMENTALQRVDNILTDVSVYLDRLLLHVETLDSFRRWRKKIKWRLILLGLIASALGPINQGVEQYIDHVQKKPLEPLGIFATIFIFAFIWLRIHTRLRFSGFINNLDRIFDQYSAEHKVLNERYTHLKSQWKQMSHHTARALRDLNPNRLPKLKQREAKTLNTWRSQRLPQLRSIVHQRESDAIEARTKVQRSDHVSAELIAISAAEADEVMSPIG